MKMRAQDEMVYATGAWPDYDPKMAESISVRRSDTEIRGGVAYTILWTDTDGEKHGRVFEYSREGLAGCLADDPTKDYPVGCASTQAGCVWVWRRQDGTEYAELQQAGPRYIKIPVVAAEWRKGSPDDPGLSFRRLDVGNEPRVFTAGPGDYDGSFL